jgi:hypothetical protein
MAGGAALLADGAVRRRLRRHAAATLRSTAMEHRVQVEHIHLSMSLHPSCLSVSAAWPRC